MCRHLTILLIIWKILNQSQVRRWRQCVSRIEPLAGLIFGLELRLEEAKEGRQPLEVVFIIVIIIPIKCHIIVSTIFFVIILESSLMNDRQG